MRVSSPAMSPSCSMRASSNMAAMPHGCGRMVVSRFWSRFTTPRAISVPMCVFLMPRRGISSSCDVIMPTFSSRVKRESRSFARSSNGRVLSWKTVFHAKPFKTRYFIEHAAQSGALCGSISVRIRTRNPYSWLFSFLRSGWVRQRAAQAFPCSFPHGASSAHSGRA